MVGKHGVIGGPRKKNIISPKTRNIVKVKSDIVQSDSKNTNIIIVSSNKKELVREVFRVKEVKEEELVKEVFCVNEVEEVEVEEVLCINEIVEEIDYDSIKDNGFKGIEDKMYLKLMRKLKKK